MTELTWFLFGAWVGASLMSVAFTVIYLKFHHAPSSPQQERVE
jgi:hypothetical protein